MNGMHYNKLETKMKFPGDPCVTENQKNSSQEKKQKLRAEEAKGTSLTFSRTKVWVGVAVMILVLASVGAGVSLASSSYILHQLGFTSKGLASKSFATRLMSSTSQANNHTVPRDSWVSWLQKAGQKGPTPEHQAYFATGGAIVGVVVALVVVMVLVMVLSVIRQYRQLQSSQKNRTA